MKKIICTLLALAMCLSMISVTTFAATDTSVWDGTVAKSFAGGTGTSSNPYIIETAAQLAYLAQVINSVDTAANYREKYYVLNSDIDLSNREWTPIGIGTVLTNSSGVIGNDFVYCTFDGKGHVVKNLKVTLDGTYLVSGLFGVTGQSTIKNVGIDTATVISKELSSNNQMMGVFIGHAKDYGVTTVSGCFVRNATIVLSAKQAVRGAGALVGYTDWGKRFDCNNSYAVNITYEAGYDYVAEGEISGAEGIGTLVGGYPGGTIINCYAANLTCGPVFNGGALCRTTAEPTMTNCFYCNCTFRGKQDDLSTELSEAQIKAVPGKMNTNNMFTLDVYNKNSGYPVLKAFDEIDNPIQDSSVSYGILMDNINKVVGIRPCVQDEYTGCQVIVAAYDETDKLTDCYVADYEDIDEDAAFKRKISQSAVKTKIMVWKDFLNLIPFVPTVSDTPDVDRMAENLKNSILNSPSSYVNMRNVYYVSPTGDDSADGKSPNTAWKSIEKVNEFHFSEWDTVLFERGGVWRGALKATHDGVTYSAYGNGDKPKIYGSECNYSNDKQWLDTEFENVYVYDEAIPTDVGLISFNNEKWGIKKFPEEFERWHDYVDKFNGISDLKNDLEFYHNKDDNKVYVYSEHGSPASRFSDIEFAVKNSIISVRADNITIDNLCLMYGAFGISSVDVSGLKVTNCEIGWIGGAIQSGSTRYGNGIEAWGNCSDFTVEHCYLYQIYDAALTHQYSGGTSDVKMENVTYRNNLIENSAYSIEYFLRPVEGTERIMRNILIEYNICRYAGQGISSQRPDKYDVAHIKTRDHAANPTENFIIRSNIFEESTVKLCHIWCDEQQQLPILAGNTYIQNGNDLVRYYGVECTSEQLFDIDRTAKIYVK